MQINKDDHYCYCSDILVEAKPAEIVHLIATGENHSKWASSMKREVSPGLWTGTSYFTGKDSIFLSFDVDHENHFVDFMIRTPEQAPEEMRMMTWARVVPGEVLGYDKGSAVLGLYQPRFAGQDIDSFLRERFLHASEMYRIKALAEQNKRAPADALPTGEYLATASELVDSSVEELFDFICDPMKYGKWTWGHSARTHEGDDIVRCKQDFGGSDLLLRMEIDPARLSVDYYVGTNRESMLLFQSARIFDAADFDFEKGMSYVTFTRWRRTGESDFEWDRAILSQLIELKMTRETLERN